MTVFAVMLHAGPRTLPNKAIEYIFGEDDWIRLFDGKLYFVSSEQAVKDLFDRLQNVVPGSDNVLVTALPATHPFAASFPQQAWDWLDKYFPHLRDLDPSSDKETLPSK